MSKRLIRFLSLLTVLALVLAACGGDDGGGTTDTEAPADTAAPDDTSAPDDTEAPDDTTAPDDGAEDPLGTVTIAAGEPIQIRSLNAISGDVASLGIPIRNAVEMAVADYGQVKGHDVDPGTALDDLCSNEGGQAAAQTIVSDDRVLGVIGTSCSGAAVAASPLISDAGMSMISPANTSPALTSDLQGNPGTDYHEGYYRTAHNDLFQGQAVAEWLYNEMGVTTAAGIHDGDPYTEGLVNAFANAFEELGGTISVITAVNVGDTDMTGALSEVAGGSPEAVYYPIFPDPGNFIAQQWGDVEGLQDVIRIGADGLGVSQHMELPESEGTYFSGPSIQFGDNVNEITGVSANDFLATYQENYGEAPTSGFWGHGYDATVMLLSAIDAVAVEGDDGSITIGRQALRDALDATNFAGLIGQVSCDEFGDCGPAAIQINHHTDSSITDMTQVEVVYEYTG